MFFTNASTFWQWSIRCFSKAELRTALCLEVQSPKHQSRISPVGSPGLEEVAGLCCPPHVTHSCQNFLVFRTWKNPGHWWAVDQPLVIVLNCSFDLENYFLDLSLLLNFKFQVSLGNHWTSFDTEIFGKSCQKVSSTHGCSAKTTVKK